MNDADLHIPTQIPWPLDLTFSGLVKSYYLQSEIASVVGLEYHMQPGHGSRAPSLEVGDVHSDPLKQKQELSWDLTHPTVLFSVIPSVPQGHG